MWLCTARLHFARSGKRNLKYRIRTRTSATSIIISLHRDHYRFSSCHIIFVNRYVFFPFPIILLLGSPYHALHYFLLALTALLSRYLSLFPPSSNLISLPLHQSFFVQTSSLFIVLLS